MQMELQGKYLSPYEHARIVQQSSQHGVRVGPKGRLYCLAAADIPPGGHVTTRRAYATVLGKMLLQVCRVIAHFAEGVEREPELVSSWKATWNGREEGASCVPRVVSSCLVS